jgi:hypothetical protein
MEKPKHLFLYPDEFPAEQDIQDGGHSRPAETEKQECQ